MLSGKRLGFPLTDSPSPFYMVSCSFVRFCLVTICMMQVTLVACLFQVSAVVDRSIKFKIASFQKATINISLFQLSQGLPSYEVHMINRFQCSFLKLCISKAFNTDYLNGYFLHDFGSLFSAVAVWDIRKGRRDSRFNNIHRRLLSTSKNSFSKPCVMKYG